MYHYVYKDKIFKTRTDEFKRYSYNHLSYCQIIKYFTQDIKRVSRNSKFPSCCHKLQKKYRLVSLTYPIQHSKLTHQSVEGGFIQWLCEDVYKLIFCRNIDQLDNSLFNMLPDKMMSHIYMLRP